nr:hypothetical protein Iba_chr02bCG17470 [Ipomoea batatas]
MNSFQSSVPERREAETLSSSSFTLCTKEAVATWIREAEATAPTAWLSSDGTLPSSDAALLRRSYDGQFTPKTESPKSSVGSCPSPRSRGHT